MSERLVTNAEAVEMRVESLKAVPEGWPDPLIAIGASYLRRLLDTREALVTALGIAVAEDRQFSAAGLQRYDGMDSLRTLLDSLTEEA